MSENKVLIIAYYWPPSGGSGVQRWLKFVKYLPTYGWTPYVFTPENPSFAVKDESLLKNVPPEAKIIRFPIWEPYELFFKLTSQKGARQKAGKAEIVATKKTSMVQTVSTWIRGNLFIPDPRVFWVRPSVKFLAEFLQTNSIDTIVTTGPPHSLHLIGLRLKKKNPNLTWIADFRDPWSTWGLLDSLMVGALARARHAKLEARVLRNADKIVTVTPFYVRKFGMLSGRKVNLLTNGYDEDDFRSITYKRPEKFTIRHVGIINEKCDPRPFMQAVKEHMQDDPVFASGLVIDFIGDVHPEFRAYVLADEVLCDVAVFSGSVPHDKLISHYGTSSLLLLVLTGYKDAEGYMPGKLFEYLATGLPILGVGPEEGDAAALLKEANAGTMLDGQRRSEIKKVLGFQFAAWQNGGFATPGTGYSNYSRRAITQQLVNLISDKKRD